MRSLGITTGWLMVIFRELCKRSYGTLSWCLNMTTTHTTAEDISCACFTEGNLPVAGITTAGAAVHDMDSARRDGPFTGNAH